MTDGSIQVETSIGRVTAEFATNGWVLLTCGERGGQSQVFRKSQLAAALRAEFSFRDDEADETALALWRQRPGDASMRATSPSMFQATGLPAWAVLPLVFAVILAIAIFYAIAQHFLP